MANLSFNELPGILGIRQIDDHTRHHRSARRWKNGDAVRARDLLSKAAAQPELGNEGFWRLALAAQAGDLDTAFELLPRLIDARDPAVIHLAVAPQWDNLRADPRFNDCLARMKLRPV